MTPGHALDDRPAQIPLKVGKLRTGDMPFGIAAKAVVRVFKGKTAIQNNQAGPLLAFQQGLGLINCATGIVNSCKGVKCG